MYEFRIMETISKYPDLSQKQLAEKCNISVGKVNYSISELLRYGLIDVVKEGKKFQYILTEDGIKFLTKELENFQNTKVNIHTEGKRIKNAVILAAGEKKELNQSACLIQLGESTLLERTIDILTRNGIEKIIIVTGYKSDKFRQLPFMAENRNIVLLENPDYKWTGSMASLARAQSELDDDFLLIEDDVLIEEDAIVQLIESKDRDSILLTKESGSDDEAYVEIRNNYLYKISKDIHTLNSIDGEMIGITKLSYDVYTEMIEIFNNNKNPLVHYEYVLLDVSRTINIGYFKISDMIWAEIDNIEHLNKVIDKVYPMLLRKEAVFDENGLIQLISKEVGIEQERITDIKPFGGMTNKNFKTLIDGEEYVVRIPGFGTDEMIDRKDEKVNSELGSKIGIMPALFYFNADSGLKIARFIPNAETLNLKTARRPENLQQITNILKSLHDPKNEMANDFDVFGKLHQYEELTKKVNGTFYEDYQDVKEEVFEIRHYYQNFNVTFTACHNDSLSENFVKNGSNDELYLIDWEYAGMNRSIMGYCLV